MELKTSNWFECSVKYEHVTEDGSKKKTSENYIVEAMSFTEAEARINEEMAAYCNGEMEIKKISPLSVSGILFSSISTDDKWYKSKLFFLIADEKTGKEKKESITYIIQADSLKGALRYVEQIMKDTSVDYVTSTISDTKVLDVFCIRED